MPDAAPAQVPGFNYSDFNSLAGLGLQGSAAPAGARVRLVPASPGQAGGVWAASRRALNNGFETVFQFQAGGPGAEGFAFVVQNNALPSLGPAGDGLGYEGIPYSLAVEFDLRPNPVREEPGASHIGVQTRRALPNSADQTASLGVVTNGLPDLADGNVHAARIVCAGSTIQVFVDDQPEPCLSVVLPPPEQSGAEEAAGQETGTLEDLLGLDDGQAWIGFTAATSDSFAALELVSWSFTPAPAPLAVNWVTPLDGASYLTPARIDLEAGAVTSTGTVQRVEFYEDATKLGEATGSPWQLTWKDAMPGTYWLTAVAIDDSGHKSVSAPIQITVYPASPPIGLNFSSGDNGTNYPLALKEEAGVVAQRIWNNAISGADGNGLATALKTGSGGITSAFAQWDFARPDEDPSVNLALSGDHKLMKSFLADDGGAGGGQSNSVIVVQQIPFPIYDVLVYSDTANGAADRVAEFRLQSQSIFLRDAPWASFAGSFAEAKGAADLGAATPAGNYVRFRSLTNNYFILTVTARSALNGAPRAGVSAIQIVPSVASGPPQVTRGPYLQSGTPTSIVVRWRSNRATDSRVRYGTSPAALTQALDDPTQTTEHLITVSNLLPYTRYYYAVGTTETNLVSGPDCYFTTNPTNPVPTRLWFVSDYGFKNPNERAVRDFYYTYTEEQKPADVWITGGDNDQTDGRDANDQIAIFGTDYGYGALLRHQVIWPTFGNHDYQTAQGQAYFANFSMPTNGEAGGLPSGTKHYYSFNYGDIHFVSLDSILQEASDSTNSLMIQWLQADLAQATQRWKIAYWHGTPYTKGSHDSDNDSDTLAWMTQMRENVLPVLEANGVDLVLCGHSHVYERTWLLNGHYGYSWSFSETNKVDAGDGRPDGTGAYLKPDGAIGTVYVTAALGGQPQSNTPEVHPAHLMKISGILGSLLIDINGDRLDYQFLNVNGDALDHFSISKEPQSGPPAAPTGLAVSETNSEQVRLVWENTPTNEVRFVLERSTDGLNFTVLATLGANETNYTDASLPGTGSWSYRLRAWNSAGASDYSNTASVGSGPGLRITGWQWLGDRLRLSWTSEAGRRYVVQQTPSLNSPNWGDVGGEVVAGGERTECEVPAGPDGPGGFYRIQQLGN